MTNALDALQELAGSARLLVPDEEQVDAAVRRAGARPARRHPRLAAVWAGLAAAVAATSLAVPSTRAALTDAFDSVFASNGGEQVVVGDAVPPWVDPGVKSARVIAGRGSERLVAFTRGSDSYCVSYGASVGECSSAAGWREELSGHPVVLRGPTGDPEGSTRTLYGLAVEAVSVVRLDYAAGPPATARAGAGGFALEVEGRRAPTLLTALDADGRTVDTIDVSDRF